MNNFTIYSYKTKTALFSGNFKDIKTCLEQAVQNKTNLKYANLKNIDLSNANLDDATLPHADFSGTNLSGTNLSESLLQGAIFNDASLYNTCLAYSDLSSCHFKNSAFGATDITGCDISNSRFSGLSCFGLEFTHTKKMGNCTFKNPCGKILPFSNPPTVITGLNTQPIILIEEHIKIGHELLAQKTG